MSAGSAARGALGAVRARLARPRSWLVVATLALGAAGWSFAALIYGAADAEARALRLAGGLAAATVAAPAWYLLVTRPGRHTLPRGAVAGAVAGVLSYPLFWTYGLALTEVAKGRPEVAAASLGIGFLFGITVGLFGLLFAPFSGAVGLVVGAAVALIARHLVAGAPGGPGDAGTTEEPGRDGDGATDPVDPADPSVGDRGDRDDPDTG